MTSTDAGERMTPEDARVFELLAGGAVRGPRVVSLLAGDPRHAPASGSPCPGDSAAVVDLLAVVSAGERQYRLQFAIGERLGEVIVEAGRTRLVS